MKNPHEGFAHLIGPEYHQLLSKVIAELDPPIPPVSPELSKNAKNHVEMVIEVMQWLAQSEERAYTGDPIEQPPQFAIVPLLLQKLGLIETPPAEQL